MGMKDFWIGIFTLLNAQSATLDFGMQNSNCSGFGYSESKE